MPPPGPSSLIFSPLIPRCEPLADLLTHRLIALAPTFRWTTAHPFCLLKSSCSRGDFRCSAVEGLQLPSEITAPCSRPRPRSCSIVGSWPPSPPSLPPPVPALASHHLAANTAL